MAIGNMHFNFKAQVDKAAKAVNKFSAALGVSFLDQNSVISYEHKRPLWARYIARLTHSSQNDINPYYWIGDSHYKRVTSKTVMHVLGDKEPCVTYKLSDFTIIKQYQPTQFKRPFFEELAYSNSLEN